MTNGRQYCQSERDSIEGPALGWCKNVRTLLVRQMRKTQRMYDFYIAIKEVSRTYIRISLYILEKKTNAQPGR